MRTYLALFLIHIIAVLGAAMPLDLELLAEGLILSTVPFLLSPTRVSAQKENSEPESGFIG